MKISDQQMTLPLDFGEVVETKMQPSRPEGISDITWSYSRRDTLEQCPLRYYFLYFGANKRAAKGEPLKEQLTTLKATENRYLRTGGILHLAISRYLRSVQRDTPLPLSDLINWSRRKFQADIAYSRDYPNLREVNGKYPPVLLREYIYQDFDASQLCFEAEERMLAAINAFYTEDDFEDFRTKGGRKHSIIERIAHLRGLPCRATGKIDLAYRDGDDVVVIDWKLGVGDGYGEDSLQLAAYGLWAMDHFKCRSTQLKVCKVHLTSREIHTFTINDEVLAAARIRIIQDAERMAALERYGQAGTANAFTPRLVRNICRTCTFEGVCYDRN